MPFVEIFTPPRPAEEKQRLMETVCSTVADTFLVSPEFISIWLHELPEENMLVPKPMISVLVHCFSGRTIEQKRELYSQLHEKVRSIDPGICKCQVKINEASLENWGIDGGRCAADVLPKP